MYGSSTELIENTDFIVDKESGSLQRITGTSKLSWHVGDLEPIKVVYTAGYAQKDVPDDIKKVCRELTAMKYREIDERTQNHDSTNDAFGAVRRFGPPMMTRGMKARIWSERTVTFPGSATWTRSEAA